MVEMVIQVKPGSSKNEIFIGENNELVVKLRAKPIDGEANAALIEFLSSALNIRKSEIELVKGATSRTKRIRLAISPSDWDRMKQSIRFRK